MTIYIEQTLATNFIVDFCILLIISKVIFSKPRLKNITISAIFGSFASLIYPFCTNWLLSNSLKILTAIIMIQLLQPKIKKQIFTSYILMLALSYVIGGAILSNFGTQNGGGYALNNLGLIPVFTVTIVSTFICCRLISWCKSKINNNAHIYDISLINNTQEIHLKAFIDSGNSLYDNNQPVSLINFDTFNKLTNISINDYINNKFDSLNNPHFIIANTIAGSRKILVFTIKQLQLKSNIVKNFSNVQIGVSLHFDNTKEYKAILNSSFCLN